MKNSGFIGIDLGGTNVRVGLITEAGETLHSISEPIQANAGPENGIQKMVTIIDEIIEHTGIKPKGIGFGATGPVDHKNGIINNPFTLATWENVDVVTPIREIFGIPVCLENDADVAALGESWMGAGVGYQNVAVVTVGTGIGTAFIRDGEIFRGFNQLHPEGGHIPIDPNGPKCYCGARGCWEVLASGSAIADQAKKLLLEYPESIIRIDRDAHRLDAKSVIAAAREGDELGKRILEQSAKYLGLGLVNLIHFHMPECIILTGGVMRSFDIFHPFLVEIIRQHSVMNPLYEIPLILAKMGQEAGMVGAARAAMLESSLQQ
jgi:glucokinase